MMKTKRCMICGGTIRVYNDHEPGDDVCCDDCEREFTLIGINPIELEPVESFDDYYFEEDEY